jgi:hypothetical protein
VSFLASAAGGSPSSDGQTHTKAAAMGEYNNTQATITSRGETRTEVKVKRKVSSTSTVTTFSRKRIKTSERDHNNNNNNNNRIIPKATIKRRTRPNKSIVCRSAIPFDCTVLSYFLS